MPTKALQDQFFQALQNSKSFKLISLEKQQELKNFFIKATDPQLQQALEELAADALAQTQYDASEQERIQKNILAAQNLKSTMQTITKEELRENIARDQVASEQSAAAILLNELNAVAPDQKPKHRKFLGIF